MLQISRFDLAVVLALQLPEVTLLRFVPISEVLKRFVCVVLLFENTLQLAADLLEFLLNVEEEVEFGCGYSVSRLFDIRGDVLFPSSRDAPRRDVTLQLQLVFHVGLEGKYLLMLQVQLIF